MSNLIPKSILSIIFSTALLTGLFCGLGQSSTWAATSYYVDSQNGNDAQSGTSPEQAWKSLDAVNAKVFHPGDKILFKAGSVFNGQLKPQGSGLVTASNVTAIVIDSYGDGPKPRIEAAGHYLDAVFIHNQDGWEIQNLDISNLGPKRQPWQTGVHVLTDGDGPMRHIHLQNLYVHDVNGDLRKSHEGCGIIFETKGDGAACFDDVLIENCHVVRTDRNGICQLRDGGARSTCVVIRGNLLEDIGGDAIKPWGSNAPLVEHNIVRGARMRCKDYAAGIWPWDCDDAVIQFNEVSGIKGTKDGEAFDSDGMCHRSIFQYNYSHDNEGGFMLLCAEPDEYCTGSIVRYNISQNDGINSGRVFHLGGPVIDSWIYNNTIYVGTNQDLPLFMLTSDDGNPSDTHIRNNLFYIDGKARIELGDSTNTVFDNNIFYGSHDGAPVLANNSSAKPALVNPGSGTTGLDSVGGYKLLAGSTPLRGLVMPNNGGHDYFGNLVSATAPPCIGACELVP